MEKITKAAKYRIERGISTYTTDFLMQNMGCRRKVFNIYVDFLYNLLEDMDYQGKEPIPKFKLPEVSSLKEDFPYLKEADSLALANAKQDFEKAVRKYNLEYDHISYTKKALRRDKSETEELSFRGLKGMPKFKSKSKGDFTYTTNCQKNSIRLKNNMLHVPKCEENIPLVLHRQLPKDAIIKTATFTKELDDFYVSICYEICVEKDTKVKDAVINDTIDSLSFIGLDYSQANLYVDSEGRKANYPHYYRKSEYKLISEQRKLSRMEKNSENYKRQKLKIAKLHKKIKDQRNDFLNKEAFFLSSNYDVVVVEDINLRNMAQCLSLGKNLNDNGFGMLRTKINNKLSEKGSMLIKIDRFFPSSQLCSSCGYKYENLKIGEDAWICPICGKHHDRDENAAINIKEEGIRIFSEYYLSSLEKTEQQELKRKALKEKRISNRYQPVGTPELGYFILQNTALSSKIETNGSA